jgi:hypothetical protein
MNGLQDTVLERVRVRKVAGVFRSRDALDAAVKHGGGSANGTDTHTRFNAPAKGRRIPTSSKEKPDDYDCSRSPLGGGARRIRDPSPDKQGRRREHFLP